MSLPEESVAANTLPEVTTIPTGKKLIFTDPDTNEGGIITLENLSKQILQNLTSQTFALDQGNLTLLQALNQLNSNTSKLYSKGIENWGTKSTSVTIRGYSADQTFIVALAGSNTARLFSFIYGIDESDNVLCENLVQGKNSITILGSCSNREITINIGNWGRGMIYSYLPFALTVS